MKKNKNIEDHVRSSINNAISSVALFFIWVLLFIYFGFSRKDLKWSDALFTSSLIYICLVGLWTLVRLGFAETSILKFKNYKRLKVDKHKKENKNIEKLSLKTLRDERSKKYWLSILFNWFISISLFATALVVTYT